MILTADAVVIGGGIVGAACAEALSRDNPRVMVVESSVVGGGATAAGMGHIVVMEDSEAEFALTRYARDLWNELGPELPGDVEFERKPTLWVAADEEELNLVRPKESFYRKHGVAAEMLDSKQMAEAEPNLRAGLAGGLRIPDDCLIYAPCAARWLIEQAVARGAQLRCGARVTELRQGQVVLDNGTRISCGFTICAVGAMAGELFPGLDVRPRKGHLAITDRFPGFVRHALIELGYLKSSHGDSNESVAFNVQSRKTGQVLIGSSRQYGAADAAIEPRVLARMLRRALEFMPGLADLPVIRTWAGFRAATPDNLPLIGPVPDRTGVYLATGHEGLGITMALGTGRLIADLVAGRQPAIAAGPYLPSRMLAKV